MIRRLLVGTFAAALLFAFTAPASAFRLPTFTASADAYIDEAAPTVAKGATAPTDCLVNDDTGSRRECRLRFVVAGLQAGDTVTSAKVLIRLKGGAGTKLVNISTVAASPVWAENTITWNNKPAKVAIVGSDSTHTIGVDSEFPLAAGTIAGNGTFNFALHSPPSSYSQGLNFHTKENTAGQPAPRLVVTINRPGAPVAALTVTPTSGLAPLDVTANASASTDPDGDIAAYAFAWGDGTTTGPQPGSSAAHTYPTAGTYTVTVTVTDSGGRTGTAPQTVVVSPNTAPVAALTASPATGETPLAVTLDASGSTDAEGNIVSYTFDPSDGTLPVTQAEATLPHTYTAAGSYTATVTVADGKGLTGTETTVVTVTPPPSPPTAALTADPTGGESPLAVTVDVDGDIASYLFTFGDGSPDVTQPTPDVDGDIVSYLFTFGDGSPDVTQPTPVAQHTYTGAGSFTVGVTVTDSGGRTSSATAGPVEVTDPPPAGPVFGINVNTTSSGGLRQDLPSRLEDYGRVPMARGPYYGTLPATFPTATMLNYAPEKRVQVSVKRQPAQIVDGSWDTALCNYWASIPADWYVEFTEWHEPNGELGDGSLNPAQFVAAWQRIGQVLTSCQETATVVLALNYTAPGNAVAWSDSWVPAPGTMPAGTLLTWDKYGNPPPSLTAPLNTGQPYGGMYRDPALVYGDMIAATIRLGYGDAWAITEINAPRRNNDQSETYRLQWFQAAVNYLTAPPGVSPPAHILFWTGNGVQFDQEIYTQPLEDYIRSLMLASP